MSPAVKAPVAWEVLGWVIDPHTHHPRERCVTFRSRGPADAVKKLDPASRIEAVYAADLTSRRQCESCDVIRVVPYVDCDECHSKKVEMAHSFEVDDDGRCRICGAKGDDL